MSQSANPIGAATESIAVDAPRISAVWLVVPCLACDFLMMPMLASFNGPPRVLQWALTLGVVGCVLAQGTLLAAWLAWSDGPFRLRLALHWAIAAGLYAVWLIGLGLAVANNNGVPLILAATIGMGVPVVSIAAQFPLWVARIWLGWRLVREQHEAGHTSEPPLTIRDLMVATLVVAVSLALARVAPSPDKGPVWPLWAVGFVVASVISAITLLPAGAMLLRMQPFSRGLLRSGLYAGAWIVLPWLVVAVLRVTGAVSLPPVAVFVGLSSLMLTFAGTLILTAAIARDRGYRLTSGRIRSPDLIN